jgi:DNA-binding response OmpR family regulator
MAKNILIVEDDDFFRELIAKRLSSEGYDISEAIDGEQGMEKIKEGNVDLVILDILLPGIDGFEVLSRVKEDSSVSSIPVVILSNLGQKEEVEKGMQLGATDYLIKAQVTSDEIVNKVKSVIGGK